MPVAWLDGAPPRGTQRRLLRGAVAARYGAGQQPGERPWRGRADAPDAKLAPRILAGRLPSNGAAWRSRLTRAWSSRSRWRWGTAPAPANPVRVEEDPTGIIVTTGTLRCRIARTGDNLIDSLSVEGREVGRNGRLEVVREDRSAL